MNSRFLQLHFLTSYGPANLNRDDLGQPKSAMLGNTSRLRVSSQSLKRAWRTSDLFKETLAGHIGTRTKKLGAEVEMILSKRRTAKEAAEWSRLIASQFGKLKTDDDFAALATDSEGTKKKSKKEKNASNEVETLVFLSADEHQAALNLAESLNEAPTPDELALLRKQNKTADLALFGRMLTAEKGKPETSHRPLYSVEAAAQVAHAITVHSAAPEDDYFTAVDDLNTREETGSSHLGELGFGAGVFYLYACIDRQLLLDNLSGDVALAENTIRALAECMATVAPTGKQNSFASRAAASYGLAELGKAQPRQLTAAFVKPVRDEDTIAAAIKRIESLVGGFDAVYGAYNKRLGFDVTTGKPAEASTIKSDTVAGDTLLDSFCRFAASELE